MAKVKNNLFLKGLSGTIGGEMVFTQRNGETIVSKAPGKRDVSSEKQIAQQRRFKHASHYGKTVMADPALKAAYEAKLKAGQTVYALAVQDALVPPVVDQIDVSAYTGAPSSVVRVFAEDACEVTDVYVTISDAGGVVIDEGAAVPEQDGFCWNYSATQELPVLTGATVAVCCHDIPKNETKAYVTLE